MRTIIKTTLAALLALTMLAAAGCGRRAGTPDNSAAPSAGPSRSPETPSASPSAPAKETAEASAEPSDGPMGSPDASPEASSDPDGISGFMEGVIVDPDEVPELLRLLSEHEDYRGMTVQSITYKLVDGRQAYYVILQGEGEASHPVYVFADDTIVSAD